MSREVLSPEIEKLWLEPLEPAEFDRRLAEFRRSRESDDSWFELIRWFRQRYPTAKERLAYVRRKYAQVARTRATTSPSDR
ncbi:hypothetical protein [Pendulispora albinea]|uniref:Uncharacterized protein n=1 Tax=Pendulispora albinea TaxID=2741071 RepID=A0ABZ2LXK1_9BACT